MFKKQPFDYLLHFAKLASEAHLLIFFIETDYHLKAENYENNHIEQCARRCHQSQRTVWGCAQT